MLKKLFISSCFLLLLLVSLFPRSVEILNHNPLFEIDQGRDYMAVKSIVVDKKITLIGAELGAGQAGLQYLFHGPGYFYLLTIPFILFNGHPIGGVYVMLLFGLCAIVFSVYLAYKLFGLKEAIVMGFLVALSPFLIGHSRFVMNHFPTPFFILLIFYCVYRFTKDPKQKLFVFLAALISAGIYNFEFAIAVPLCIALVAYCLLLYQQKIISLLSFLVAGFLIGFSPMILFEIRHGFMGVKSLLAYLFIYHSQHELSPNLIPHAHNIINLFVYSFGDSFPGHLVLPVSIILPIFISIVDYVFYKEKDEIIKNFFIYILLLYPINMIVFMLLRNIIF